MDWFEGIGCAAAILYILVVLAVFFIVAIIYLAAFKFAWGYLF